MKNLLVAFALLGLVACGTKDKPKSDSAIGIDQSPQVSIPASATLTDYRCEEVATYSASGAGGLTERTTYSGVDYTWFDADSLVTYSQDNNGQKKELARERSQDNGNQRHSVIDMSTWLQTNTIWSKKTFSIDQITALENGQRRIISYKVDGKATAPTWSSFIEAINNGAWKKTERHLNPASRNDGTRAYTSIDRTCFYAQRWN